MHGGGKVRFVPGSKHRNNTPQKHGLYSKFIRNKDERRIYRRADVDKIDDEIRVAKAKLAWSLRQHMRQPDGGVVVSESNGPQGSSTKIMLWIEIVERHLDNVRKLVATRAALKGLKEEDEDLETYEQWLANNKSKSPTQEPRS